MKHRNYLSPTSLHLADFVGQDKELGISKTSSVTSSDALMASSVGSREADYSAIESDPDLWQLSSAEIDTATNGFSKRSVVGEGGFARVFRGQLYGTDVAVKQLKEDTAATISDTTFWKEVSILARLRHPHILLLIGCCVQNRSIVTEFMEGGSLQDQLSPKNTSPLPWKDRFRIALELSSGLLHMHIRKILHRDLKPENVLLSKHRISKLSDVGLSKLYTNQATIFSVVRGTYGYVDPYQQMTGQLTRQSDIYALGLVLLQLFLGIEDIAEVHKLLEAQGGKQLSPGTKEPVMAFLESLNHLSMEDKESVLKGNLTESVMKAVNQSKSRWPGGVDRVAEELCSSLDTRAGAWPMDEAKFVLKLALTCVETQREFRPDLAVEIVPELYKIYQHVKWVAKSANSLVFDTALKNKKPSKPSRGSSLTSSLDFEWPKSEESAMQADAILGLGEKPDESFEERKKALEPLARHSSLPEFTQGGLPNIQEMMRASEGTVHRETSDPRHTHKKPPQIPTPPKSPKLGPEPVQKAHSTATSTGSTPSNSRPTSPPAVHAKPAEQPNWARKWGWLHKQKRSGMTYIWDQKFYELYSDPLRLCAFKALPVTHTETPDKSYLLLPLTKVMEKGPVTVNGKPHYSFLIQGKGFWPLTFAADDKELAESWVRTIQQSLAEQTNPPGTTVKSTRDLVPKPAPARKVGRPQCIATIPPPALDGDEGVAMEGSEFGRALAFDGSGTLWTTHGAHIYGFRGEALIASVSAGDRQDAVSKLLVHVDLSVFSGTEGGRVCQWDWNEDEFTLTLLSEVAVGGHVSDLACASDGAVWAAHGATVEAFARGDLHQGMESLCTFRLHTGAVEALAPGAGGLVWSGSRDGSVRGWKKDQGCVFTVQAGIGPVVALACGLDGLLWAGGEKGSIVSIRERRVERLIEGRNAICARAFVVTGNGVLWSGHDDCSVKGWQDGKCVATLIDHDDSILALAAGEDGGFWSSSADEQIMGWRMVE